MPTNIKKIIQRYCFQIDPEISNTKLRKLSHFYKIIYLKNDRERTIENLQIIIDHHNKKNKESKIQQKMECVICYEMLTENMLVTRCNHAFCQKCIINYLSEYNESCPVCRHPYQIFMFVEDKQLSEERLEELMMADIQICPIDYELHASIIHFIIDERNLKFLIFAGFFTMLILIYNIYNSI